MHTLLCVPSFFSLGCANSSFMPVLALVGPLSLEGKSFCSLHTQKHVASVDAGCNVRRVTLDRRHGLPNCLRPTCLGLQASASQDAAINHTGYGLVSMKVGYRE